MIILSYDVDFGLWISQADRFFWKSKQCFVEFKGTDQIHSVWGTDVRMRAKGKSAENILWTKRAK